MPTDPSVGLLDHIEYLGFERISLLGAGPHRDGPSFDTDMRSRIFVTMAAVCPSRDLAEYGPDELPKKTIAHPDNYVTPRLRWRREIGTSPPPSTRSLELSS